MSDKTGAPQNQSTPPVNLTELELTVARDPGSDAVVPLLEAYLGQSRFMEAMVLGKKAIKAKPDDASRRILLARVYELQNKIPKAIEEMVAYFKTGATHVPSLIYLGKLYDKAGNTNEAVASWKAAIDLDNHNAEAKEALAAKGVTYEKAPPPPPPPPPAPAMVPATPGARAGRANSIPPQRANSIPPQQRTSSLPSTPAAPAGDSLPPMPAGDDGMNGGSAEAGSSQAPRAARRPRPRREAFTEEELGIAPKETAKGGLGTTLKIGAGGLAVLALLVVGMAFYRVRTEKLSGLSKPAKEFVAMDSLPSLRKALKNFEEMVQIDSGQSLAVANIAYIHTIFYTQYGMQNEKAAAEQAVSRAESDAKEVSLTFVAKAMMMLKDGQATDALTLLDKIRSDMGETAALQVAMGDAYLALGKLDDAGTAYARARERSSKEARALYATGEFMRQIGRGGEAMGNFDSVLRIDGDHSPARMGRVLLRLESGTADDVIAAKADLQRLNERSENVGPYYQSLGLVAAAELARLGGAGGDPKKLLDDARKALGPIPDVVMAQARLEMDNGKPADAVKMLKDVVAKFPGWLAAYTALIRAQIAAGQFAEAEQTIQKAQTTVGKQNLDLAILVGIARREKKDFKGSEDAFKKAFEIAKDHPKVQLELARTYTEMKRFPDAIALERAALENGDTKPAAQAEVYTALVATLAAKGDMDLAFESAEQAVKTEPNYAPAWYWRGVVLRDGKKNPAEARASFQKYLDKAPKGELARQATAARDAIR